MTDLRHVTVIEDFPLYRGFLVGYHKGPNGYHAAWRSSLEYKWYISSALANDLADVPQLAKECIDYYYRQHAIECDLGRKLTIDEIIELHQKGEL